MPATEITEIRSSNNIFRTSGGVFANAEQNKIHDFRVRGGIGCGATPKLIVSGVENAKTKFMKMAEKWKQETKFVSSITTKSIHPTYQKIIGMGETAVPFILEDLKDNGPRDWFWALTMITDENPITEEIAGNMKAMTEAWLQWGIKTGYLKDSPQRTRTVSNCL